MRLLDGLPIALARLSLITITWIILSSAHALEKKEDGCTTCWGDWHSGNNNSPTTAVTSPKPSEVVETVSVVHTITVSGSYDSQGRSTTSTSTSKTSTTSQAGYGSTPSGSHSSSVGSPSTTSQPMSSQSSTTSSSSSAAIVSSVTGVVSTTQSTSMASNSPSGSSASPPSSGSSSSIRTQQSSSFSSTTRSAQTSPPESSITAVTVQSSFFSSSSLLPSSQTRPSSSIAASASSAATQTSTNGSLPSAGGSPSTSEVSLTSRTVVQTLQTTVTGSQTTSTALTTETVVIIFQPSSPSTPLSGPTVGQPPTTAGASPSLTSSSSTSSPSIMIVPATNPAPPQTISTVAPTAPCTWNDVLPWCTSIQDITNPVCLCPECYGDLRYCSAVKPTGTTVCPDLWRCSLGVDPEGHVTHPLPPGYDFTRTVPTSATTTTLPWWQIYSTLTATDHPQTTDALFNATLEFTTVTQSDGSRIIFPHREWKCMAGPLCFPIGFDFHLFDFLCFFRIPPQCGAGFWNIWPKPRFPFPPPKGPASLDYELTPTTLPPDGNNDPQSTATTTKSCTETSTFSRCSTACSTFALSSLSSETCTSRCTTTSGCFGTDLHTTTTTGEGCSISEYWNDPAIASSVSSILDRFPFEVDDVMPFSETTSTTAPGPSSTGSSSTASGSATRSTSPKTSTVTETASIDFSWSHPTSSTTPPPSTTATIDWPARSQACRDYNYNIEERDDYLRFPHSLHSHALCADVAEDDNFAYFWWDDAVITDVCESMRSRNVSMKWDPDTWTSEEQIQDVSSGTSECYRYRGPTGNYYNENGDYDILVQIALDAAGCDFDLDVIWGSQCKDPQCLEFPFASYSMDDCRYNFDQIHKECKEKNRDGKKYTVGGSFFNDCMRWSIVAGGKDLKALPLPTDDQPVGLGTGPQALALGRIGMWKRVVSTLW